MKNKVALITGSTRGIGFGLAQALARQGVHVMLHGLGEPDECERIRAQLAAETGVTVGCSRADLAKEGQVAQLWEETRRRFDGVDILVNNAGVQFVSPVDEFPPARWSEIQSIILTASFETIRAALPGMKQKRWGRIINVASAHGLVASPFKSAYIAAKHGLIGLTKTVALEVAEQSITCNAVCPGYVRTALVENQIESQARTHGISREAVLRDIILAAQPTKRLVEIDEVADFVVFLCSDAARSITGAALPIDGGWTAR